jgi:signal peptidase I
MLYLFLALVFLLFLLRRCLVIITVHGHSMHPTLVDGDRVLSCRCMLRWLLRRGKLVVCQNPQTSLGNRLLWNAWVTNNGGFQFMNEPATKKALYIKRLWGLAGENIVIPAQDVPSRSWPNTVMAPQQDDTGNFVWQVPPGHCFVKGDSPYSYDSTSWGPIPLDYIVGIVLLKLPRRAEAIDPAGSSPSAPIELPER